MTFTRFGNAFIAHDRNGRLYVVSLYMNSWHAYVEDNKTGAAHVIERYGYGPGEAGLRAAQLAATNFAGEAA